MHVTDRDLTLYVSAQLTPSRMLWLENHCEVCESCAQAVCQEAQLELNLRAWTKEERCGRRAEAPSSLVISEKVPTVHPEPPSAKLRTGFDKAQDRIRRGTLDDTSARPSTSLGVSGAIVGSSAQVLQTLFLFGSMVFAMMLLMSSHLERSETLSPLSPNQTWLSDAGGLATYLKRHPSTGEIGISGGTP